MAQVNKISMILDVNGKPFIRTMTAAEKKTHELANAAEKSSKKINKNYTKTSRGLASISKQLAATRNQVVGLFALSKITQFAGGMVYLSDTIKLTNSRLLQATGSQSAFNIAQNHAKRIASESRSDYLSTVNLLSRLTTAADQYNIAQDKVAKTTEAVTYGLKLYGATAAEVSSVQTQLSQALASGTLAGDEFKSMAEASPRLMQALADGLGVARGELKQMAADGKLTTEIVISALAGQADVLKAEFAEMPITVADAWGQLKNAMTGGASVFDQITGWSDLLASVLMWLAENTDVATTGFKYLLVGAMALAAARYLPALLIRITIGLKSTAAGSAIATAGISRMSVATMAARAPIVTATVAARGLRAVMMGLGGPLGIVIGLVAMLGAEWAISAVSGDDMADASSRLGATADGAKSGVADLGSRIAALNTQMSAGTAEARKLSLELQKLALTRIAEAQAGIAARKSELQKISERGSANKAGSDAQYARSYGYDNNPGVKKRRNELNTEIASLNTSLSELEKQKKSIETSIKNINATGVNIPQKTTYTYKEMRNAVGSVATEIKNLEYQLNSGQISQFRYNKRLEVLKGTLKTVPLGVEELGKQLGWNKSQLDVAREGVSAYKTAVKNLDDKLVAGLITKSEYNQQLKAAGNNLSKNSAASKLYAHEQDRLNRRHGGGARKIRDMGEAAESTAGKLKSLDEQRRVIADFIPNQQQRLADMAFEASLIGKQADEVERLRYAHELESAAKQAKQGLSVANQAVIAGEVNQLKQQYDLLVAQRKETEALQEQDWQGGLIAGLKDWQNQAGSLYDTMKNGSKNALDSMSNGLANFVATGKADFRSLTVSILADLSKMFIKASMMKMFGSLFSGFFSNGGVFGSSGQISFGIGQYALGGAFDGGVQYYANGDVFNRPTAFAHAGGLGVMGEAGPEAIMPLTRGADGKLGVKMHGAASKSNTAGMVNHITIAVNVSDGNVDGDAQSQKAQGRQLAENLDGAVRAVLAREIRPGGMLNNGR